MLLFAGPPARAPNFRRAWPSKRDKAPPVRTTVEIKDEHRAKLLELAALRGKKGFSDLIEEALELYLESLQAGEQAKQKALAARGSLSAEQTDELRERARAVRETWR